MSSYYAAELEKLRARDRDVDKAVRRGVEGGTGVADYLFRGEDLDLKKRMQEIHDAREARAQGKWDMDLTKRRAEALTSQVQRENEEAREAAYEKELKRLKAERAAHESDNRMYNKAQAAISEGLDARAGAVDEQAWEIGQAAGDNGDVQVQGEQQSVTYAPVAPPAPPRVQPNPLSGGMRALAREVLPPGSDVNTAVEEPQPKRLLTSQTLTAPKGYGFDAAGKLVRDPGDGSVSKTLEDAPENRFVRHDKILTDAEIQEKARKYAAELELQNVRQTVMGQLKSDPANAATFKLMGDMGVQDMVDDYLGEQGAAKAKRDQQAFDNAITDREMSDKERKTANDLRKTQLDVFEAIGKARREAAEIGLQAKDLDRKEREFQHKVNKYRDRARGNPNKFSKDTEKTLKRMYDKVFDKARTAVTGANRAAVTAAQKYDVEGRNLRADWLERNKKRNVEAVYESYGEDRPLIEAMNEGFGSEIREFAGALLEAGVSEAEVAKRTRAFATEKVRLKRGGVKKPKPADKPAKGEVLNEEAKAAQEAHTLEYYTTEHGRAELIASLTPEEKEALVAYTQKKLEELKRSGLSASQLAEAKKELPNIIYTELAKSKLSNGTLK